MPPPLPKGAETKRPDSKEEVQVLRVRPLTTQERDQMAGFIHCSDPLMAEIRLTGRLRAIVAGIANNEKMPAILAWVFSKTGACFNRPQGIPAHELDAVDEACRVAARRGAR
jgi:hypothetical protein